MNASKEEARNAFYALSDLEKVVSGILEEVSEDFTLPSRKFAISHNICQIQEFLQKAESKLPSEAAYERERQRRASKPKLKAPLMPEVG